jgi:hypothetical protein
VLEAALKAIAADEAFAEGHAALDVCEATARFIGSKP